tara:strand:+ start:221 stop:496 length:276 start_codon:yes stop_codon:yes gene_type:complete
MSTNKYIKIMVFSGEPVFYRVMETRNINFVEPGYEFEVTRPQTLKDAFAPGFLANVDVYLVEDNEPRGTKNRPLYITTPEKNPIEAVNGND